MPYIRRCGHLSNSFRDVSSQGIEVPEAFTWNGKNIDRDIPGYCTLKVKGREDNARTVTKQERPGDGSVFGYSFYDDKEIIVTFSMEAKTPEEFMQRWDKLRQTLVTGNYSETKFSFADEPGTFRYGTIKTLDNPDVGKLNVIGTLTIELTKPFKYFNAKTISLVNGAKLADPNLVYPVVPDKLVIKKANQPVIKIDGTNKNITFHGAYDAGMDIVIDFNKMTVIRSTTNVMDGLDIKSTLGTFKIKNGDTFIISGCEAIELTYKAVII